MRGKLVFGNTINFLFRRLYSTVSNTKRQLVLFTSEDCSLCIHFKKHLDIFLQKNNNLDLDIEIRNIKECDSVIFEKYKHDVPVLVSEDNIVCKHRFSSILFKRFLGLSEQ